MITLIFSFLLAFIILFILNTFIAFHKARSFRFIADSVIRFRFEYWLDQITARVVRLVEEGGLPGETEIPTSSEAKFKLACNILQDVISFAGFDVKNYNVPALIKSKVNEIYHGQN